MKKCKKFILLMIFSIVISFNTQNVFAINGVTILKQPVDAYSVSGATVSYTVEAAGTGLTYQWQYSLDGGKKWLTSTGWTSATCSFKGAENYSGRQFRCVVKDASGNSVTSAAAKYICEVQLSIKSQPKDVTAKAGETVSYTVEAAGTGLTYQWQYSLDGGKKWLTSTGWTSATCSFKGAENYSGRQFRCVVKDASGNSVTSAAAKYICEVQLSIKSQPKDVTAKAGETVSYTVEAAGTGLTYQWQYSLDGGKKWLTSTGWTSATCSFKGAENYSGRQFRCVVKDASGNSVTSAAAKYICITTTEDWELPIL